MKIAGTVALVTGASSGIGAAIAAELARRGATVVGTARRQAELEAAVGRARRHSPGSIAVAADLAEPGEAERVVVSTIEQLGRVDIVVNNAGMPLRRHALDTTVDDVERVMRVNFLAAVATTATALPGMVERGRGSIVNVTSVAGSIPNPHESAYGASKAALHLWSHVLAVDLAGTGVHVGTLSPGPIDTEIWTIGDPAAYRGRKYPPQVVADAAARMITDELVQATVPRQYGAVGALYGLPLVNRLIRRGLVGFAARTRHQREPHP